MQIASAKCESARGASHQQTLIGSCLTISQTRLSCLRSTGVGPGVLYPIMIGLIVASVDVQDDLRWKFMKLEQAMQNLDYSGDQ